ncbi:MAG TPA: hypothetical protein VGB50_00375 [Flavobacterium sp.]|jgi:hypothetical protein
MDWHIKAFIQKVLAVSRFGDKMNHHLITLNKNYHKNVVTYQSHEALRKFSYSKLDLSNNLVALEIGTGYSLVSAISLALVGFEKIITVDITKDVTFSSFQKQSKYLDEEIFVNSILTHSKFSQSELRSKIGRIRKVSSLAELFELLNINYIAPYSFDDIEKVSAEFDYITSQVVLEHVSPDILDTLFKKTKHWIDKDGYCVHTINFIDHFANPGLFQDKSISEFNFLKYSDKYWESWTGNSIAYTNRLSYLYYLELAEKYNFKIVDFLGENYRDRVDLNPALIHPDVIKKYSENPNRDSLTKYQRGTLILKGGRDLLRE